MEIENSFSYQELKANSQKEENGMREECKYHAHFTSRAARDILIFLKKEINQQNLINQYSAKQCV